MTNDKIKQLARELLQPVYDTLVDTCVTIYSPVAENLPNSLSDEQKLEMIKGILDAQSKSIQESMKASLPEDFEQKLKEAYNGRK